MRALKAAVRVLSFTGKFVLAAAGMLAVGLLQAPAVLWYVVAATPACGAAVTTSQLLLARVGLGALGATSAALAIYLGVRFLRLRWGWSLWWIVVAASLTAPAVVVYMLPHLSPGTGGLLCH
jgi:hypothetical protein